MRQSGTIILLDTPENKRITRPDLDALVRQYPNYLTAAAIGKFLGKSPQAIRYMAQDGTLPFAIAKKSRRRYSYLFPTARFVAWYNGTLS